MLWLVIYPYQTSAGQVSTDFISRLATSLKNSPIDSNPLDDTSVLNQALTSSGSVQPTVQTSEISNAVSLIESADNLLIQTLNRHVGYIIALWQLVW